MRTHKTKKKSSGFPKNTIISERFFSIRKKFFVDPDVKINSEYYKYELLSKMLPFKGQ